jgi:hypothetical protein
MARRHTAVAATFTAFVIFGTIVASNYALYESEEQRAILYTLSDQANYVGVEAEFAKGAAALTFLHTSQVILERIGKPDCSHPSEALRPLQSLVVSQSLGRVNASMRGFVAAGGAESDNLTMVAPFNGFVPGYLNFGIHVDLDFSTPHIAYHKAELHYLHLPILYERSIDLCLSAFQYLNSRLRAIERPPGVCATPSILEAVGDANRLYGAVASGWGLALSASASVEGSRGCPRIDYEVVVSQVNVTGVSGEFTWSVFEGSSLLA